jgi:hypothetical protein
VPAHAEPVRSPRSTKRWMFVAAAGLAVTGYFAVRSPSAPPPVAEKAETPAPANAAPAPREQEATKAPVQRGEPAGPRSPAAPAAADPLPRPPPPADVPKDSGKDSPREPVKSARSSKPVPPNATRVRLEVHPPDAKVGRRGVTQKPPYEFDVPKGKRIALEVLKKGYVTRKVTLDGTSTRVVVGLNRAKATRGSR